VANGPSAHPAQSLGSFEQLLSAAGLRGGNASSVPAVRPNARVAPPGPNDGLTHIRQGLATIATIVKVAERRDRDLQMKHDDLAVGRGSGDSESKKGDGSESTVDDSVVSGDGEGKSLEGERGDGGSGESIIPSFVLGQWIDARDTIDQWLEATVLDLRPNEVFICYNGWPDHWNEWIPKNSARLSPFRTKTKHTNHKYLNPCPFQWVADAPSVSPPSDNVFKLIPEVLSLMRTVEPMLQQCIGEERKVPDSLAPILDRFGRILGDLAQPLKSLNRGTNSAEEAAGSAPPPSHGHRTGEGEGGVRSTSPSRSVATPLPPLRSTAAPASLREGLSDLTQGRSSSATSGGVINSANGSTTSNYREAGNNGSNTTTHGADGDYSDMPHLEENYDSVSDGDEPPPLLPASMLDTFSDDELPPPLPITAHDVDAATPVVRRTPRTLDGVMLPLSMEESNRRLALRYFRCVDHVMHDTSRRPNVDIHIHAIVAPMGGQGADQGHQVNGATAVSLNEQIQNALNLQLQGQLSGATAPSSGGLGMSAETVARPPNGPALPSGPPTHSNWNGGSVTQAALQSISSRIGGWLGLRSAPVAPVSATGNSESVVPTEPSTVSTSDAPVSSDAPHNPDPNTRNRVDALLQLIRRELSSLDAEEGASTGSIPVTGPGYGDAYTTVASLPGMVDDHDPTGSATDTFLMSGDRPDTMVEADPYFPEMHEGREGEDGNGDGDGIDSDDEMPPLAPGSSDDEY
jgi:hypothetical protein